MKKLFSPIGRLVYTIISILLFVVTGGIMLNYGDGSTSTNLPLILIIIMIVWMIICYKRLKDTFIPAWLVMLVPFIAPISLIILMFIPSKKKESIAIAKEI